MVLTREKSFVGSSPSRSAFADETDHAVAARKAWHLFEQGNFKAAIREWQKLQPLYPDSAELLALVGIAFFRLDRFLDAVEILRRANTLAPENPDVLNILGASLASLGEEEEALSLLTNAHERSPSEADIVHNLTLLLARMGRSREAIALIDQRLRQDTGVDEKADLQDLREAVISTALSTLVDAGLATWSGRKPKLPKRPIKLREGVSAGDYIVDERNKRR